MKKICSHNNLNFVFRKNLSEFQRDDGRLGVRLEGGVGRDPSQERVRRGKIEG